ncbi:NAD(+) synthase [Candidatus Woesearchaeota archaeon]|nr:NAD(+) synthase [Candidatus Woesearchaeota archaeon]
MQLANRKKRGRKMPIDDLVVEAPAIHITMGDMEANYQTMLEATKKAAEKGVDLIAFPEMATCGYAVGDDLEMVRFLENNKKVVEKLAEETKDLDIAIALGFVDFDKKKTGHDGKVRRYNAAAVLQKGEIKGTIYKHHLPNYTLFDEKRWFTPGEMLLNRPIAIDIRGKQVRLGVGICEDKWVEDYEEMRKQDLKFGENVNLPKQYKEQGADLLVWLNASPFHAGKFIKIETINRARVAETGLPLVDVNFVGIGDNTYDLIGFSGESAVLDAKGEYITTTRPWEVESAIARINLKTGEGKELQGNGKPKTILGGKDFIAKYVDQVIDALVYMAGEYVRQSPCTGVLESMSGGIDSSVGTAIAALAQRKGFFDWVDAYTFPTQYNTETTKGIAFKVAENLGIDLKVIPIQNRFVQATKDYARIVMEPLDYALAEEQYKTEGVKAFYGAFNNKVTPENIQARIRSEWMKVLSNEFPGLEFVNPNKDERRQGYTTINGDMAGGLAVLGDLDKWLVRAVASRINEREGKEIIPRSIIYNVNPTAELSDEQNPEKGGGDPFDYVVLGMILDNYTFARKDVPEIVEDFKRKQLNAHYYPVDMKEIYTKFTVDQFEQMTQQYLTKNEIMRYKGVVFPLAPKVTRRALGFELRTPVTSNYFRSAERRKQEGFY